MAVGTAVLEFASDEPLARPVVDTLYHAADRSESPPSHRYRITRSPAGWLATAPHSPRFGPAPLEDVFTFLEWRATEDLLADQGSTFLHAAGIRLGSRNVLLVGQSGAGKSSLAAHLLARGHLAWGDDVVRFASRDRRFSAVPRSWKLDAKTMESLYLLSLLEADGVQGMLIASSVLYMSPAAFRRHWQAPEAPADVLVLLDAAAHRGQPALQRMSDGEAAVRTARMLLGGGVDRSEGSDMMVAVVEAMSNVAAYRLAGTPPSALARMLEQELAA